MRPFLPPGKLLNVAMTASTQDEALALVRAGDRRYTGVRALHQTAGRGRRDTRWEAPPGTCLLVTYILRGVQPGDARYLGFAASVAVCEAVDALFVLSPTLQGERAAVKWPNDVLMGGRKLAGILVETVSDSDCALVGIGLNVNVAAFVPGLSRMATSLLLESGRQWNLEEVEHEVRAALAAIAPVDWPAVLARWRERDATRGLRYVAFTDEGETEGTAVGVSQTGELLLRTDAAEIVRATVATSVTAR